MAELKDNELNTINAGANNPDPGLNGFWDVMKKMGKGIKDVVKPVVKSPAPPVVDKDED